VEAPNLYSQETYRVPEVSRTPKKRWRFRWKPGSIILLAVLGYVMFSFGQVYYQIHRLTLQKEELKQQLNQLKVENGNLHEKAYLVQTDAYIERLAREDFGMVKPGETVMVPAYPGEVKVLKETERNADIRD